jgi:hypothetical protein
LWSKFSLSFFFLAIHLFSFLKTIFKEFREAGELSRFCLLFSTLSWTVLLIKLANVPHQCTTTSRVENSDLLGSFGVDLLTLFFKLDHFLKTGNICSIALERSSLQERLSKFTPKNVL